jgi:hypothetical protein
MLSIIKTTGIALCVHQLRAVDGHERQLGTMKETTKRSILRWIHLVFALPLLGYIYGPPSETVQYLPYFRFFYFPALALSGLWMWKGHVARRLLPGRNQ